MKNKTIGAAFVTFLACALVATGDATTLYGRIDRNLTKITGERWKVKQASTSRVGLRGAENIGRGRTLVYQLETAVNLDADARKTFVPRENWVGLSGGFGTLRLGRSLSPSQRIASNFDPYSTDGIGSFGSEGLLNRMAGLARLNNAVWYETPAYRGLSMSVAHRFRQSTSADKSASSAQLRYRTGPFDAALGYAHMGSSSNTVRSAAFAYDFGVVRPMAQLHTGKTNNKRYRTALVGLTAPIGKGEYRIAYSRQDQRGSKKGKRSKFATGVDYSVSPRTAVYAHYARDRVHGKRSTHGVEIRIRHNF